MALEDKNKIDPRALRHALGCFATGVAVVTSVTRGRHQIGLTINSFSSLSLEPPLVLWSLSLDSGLKDHFQPGCPFVINFLAEGQQDIAHTFAKAREDRFRGIRTREGLGGAPLFEDHAGYIECETAAVHPGGDHIIIVGRVVSFGEGQGRPLIFHKGAYRALHKGKGTDE